MIPRENRLKRDSDFKILFAEGRFVSGRLLNAKIWLIDPTKYPTRDYKTIDLKIGFTVGLKISKNAVVRNRLRRQMREVIRLLIKEGKLRVGFMVLFIAKPEMIGKEYAEIEEDIIGLVKRCGALSV